MKKRSHWQVVLFSILTFGIYYVFYAKSQENDKSVETAKTEENKGEAVNKEDAVRAEEVKSEIAVAEATKAGEESPEVY